ECGDAAARLERAARGAAHRGDAPGGAHARGGADVPCGADGGGLGGDDLMARATAAGGVLDRLRSMGREGDVDTVVEHYLPGNATARGELFQLLGRATPGSYDFIAGLIEFQRRHAVGGQFYQAFTGLMRSLGLEKAKRAPRAEEGAAPAPKRKR